MEGRWLRRSRCPALINMVMSSAMTSHRKATGQPAQEVESDRDTLGRDEVITIGAHCHMITYILKNTWAYHSLFAKTVLIFNIKLGNFSEMILAPGSFPLFCNFRVSCHPVKGRSLHTLKHQVQSIDISTGFLETSLRSTKFAPIVLCNDL